MRESQDSYFRLSMNANLAHRSSHEHTVSAAHAGAVPSANEEARHGLPQPRTPVPHASSRHHHHRRYHGSHGRDNSTSRHVHSTSEVPSTSRSTKRLRASRSKSPDSGRGNGVDSSVSSPSPPPSTHRSNDNHVSSGHSIPKYQRESPSPPSTTTRRHASELSTATATYPRSASSVTLASSIHSSWLDPPPPPPAAPVGFGTLNTMGTLGGGGKRDKKGLESENAQLHSQVAVLTERVSSVTKQGLHTERLLREKIEFLENQLLHLQDQFEKQRLELDAHWKETRTYLKTVVNDHKKTQEEHIETLHEQDRRSRLVQQWLVDRDQRQIQATRLLLPPLPSVTSSISGAAFPPSPVTVKSTHPTGASVSPPSTCPPATHIVPKVVNDELLNSHLTKLTGMDPQRGFRVLHETNALAATLKQSLDDADRMLKQICDSNGMPMDVAQRLVQEERIRQASSSSSSSSSSTSSMSVSSVDPKTQETTQLLIQILDAKESDMTKLQIASDQITKLDSALEPIRSKTLKSAPASTSAVPSTIAPAILPRPTTSSASSSSLPHPATIPPSAAIVGVTAAANAAAISATTLPQQRTPLLPSTKPPTVTFHSSTTPVVAMRPPQLAPSSSIHPSRVAQITTR
jgi:hypothetical protein